jgi:glycine cleavage system H lipoate-binding protein
MAILIFIAFLGLCILTDGVIQYSRRRKSKAPALSAVVTRVFNEASVTIPKGLYFDKTHTWAFMEKNGLVKIGIDDFLPHVTGVLNRVKMKQPGEKINKGEPLISIIQNGKHLTVYAPISGTIKSLNDQLMDDSTLINSSPYHNGWLYAVEPYNWIADIQSLFMQDKYKEWLKIEFSRLKDFFAIEWKTSDVSFVPIMLQDGGELNDNVLADFGPEVWEEFQTKFLNRTE